MPHVPPSRRSLLLGSLGAALAPRLRAGNPALTEATQAVRAAMPTAEHDPTRPVYHFHSPAQWHNDPNGTIYYKGWHHLFYQLNPYGSEWGNMHWGHARSRDMVNWEHLPIALWPSRDKGEQHVFSGCAVPGPDGRPRLIYTSIGARDPEQWLANPLDDELLTWEKDSRNPILTSKAHGSLTVREWRDPFVFEERGNLFMVCGGNLRGSGGRGSVELYQAESRDLTRWRFLAPIFIHPNRAIYNIECPNLFRLGAKWVLLVSPESPVQYFVGDLDLQARRFLPEREGTLDPGPCYATNISRVGSRTILWIWGRTATPIGRGWNSVMTIPRELSLSPNNDLEQRPISEISSLRAGARRLPEVRLETNTSHPLPESVWGDCLDIQTELHVEKAGIAGIRLRGTGTNLEFNPKTGALRVGHVEGFAGVGASVKLRILLDKRVLEVYANDGAAAVYETTDAGPAQISLELFSRDGPAAFRNLEITPMRPARFDMSRF